MSLGKCANLQFGLVKSKTVLKTLVIKNSINLHLIQNYEGLCSFPDIFVYSWLLVSKLTEL